MVSLGATVGTIMEIAREAPFVIAEVNAQTPRTLGNSFLHLRDIDLLVDADYPVIQRKGTPIGESERRIAESVAELVPDGATIQTGIGAIPEALIGLLEGKRDLGVHSGMISDGYINLIERGIVNNTKKSFDKHKLVIGEVMGTAELFRYVNDNTAIHFDSVSYTHNPNLVQEARQLRLHQLGSRDRPRGTSRSREYRAAPDQRYWRTVRFRRGCAALQGRDIGLRNALDGRRGEGVPDRTPAFRGDHCQHPTLLHRLRGHRIRRRLAQGQDHAAEG